MSRFKFFALAIGAGLVLLPLYGDPRQAPITHAEWGRMMLTALELDAVVQPGDQASRVFSTLSWKESLSFRADQYARSEGTSLTKRRERLFVVSSSDRASVYYPLTVVRSGDYGVRVKLEGPASAPAVVEILGAGDSSPAATFAAVPLTTSDWVAAGKTHLEPGAYFVKIDLPDQTALERVEVTPPCLVPVEPLGGWKGTALLYSDDVAVTLLRATVLEYELPPADSPTEIPASHFALASPTTTQVSTPPSGEDSGSAWLTADEKGLQAVVVVDVPEDGLYTLWAYGVTGAGQSWQTDGCSKSVVCPATKFDGPQKPSWQAITTREMSAGQHSFAVTLGEGASLGRMRLERKKTDAEAYLSTLRRLGFDAGEPGPITRERAIDALSFLRKKVSERTGEACWEVLVPPSAPGAATGVRAELGTPQILGPGQVPPSTGTPPGGLQPPVLSPQDVASPVQPAG